MVDVISEPKPTSDNRMFKLIRYEDNLHEILLQG